MTRRPIDKGMTPSEQRAYKRGYNNGRNRAWRGEEKVRKIAASWRAKVQEGMGGARCDQCAFWQRGGPPTRWGVCSQNYSATPVMGWAWAESTGDHHKEARLVTHENFACINFMRKD
jgi:hypothetical protein